MSRYLLLLLLNAPFITAGLINSLVSYKLGRLRRKKFAFQVSIWLAILGGLVITEPLYLFLFSHNLTQTEPLSLFDVIQITGIVFGLFVISRHRARIDATEKRLHDLHRELSIRASAEGYRKR